MCKHIMKVETIGGEYRITIKGHYGLPDTTYCIDKATFDKAVKETELADNRKPNNIAKGI